jgi:hypothetical protein
MAPKTRTAIFQAETYTSKSRNEVQRPADRFGIYIVGYTAAPCIHIGITKRSRPRAIYKRGGILKLSDAFH